MQTMKDLDSQVKDQDIYEGVEITEVITMQTLKDRDIYEGVEITR